MRKNSAEVRVGRLLEVRVDAGYRSADDVDALFDMLAAAVKTLPTGSKHVTIVDWRLCPIMSPETATYVTRRMVAVNETTERSATVAPVDAPTTVLQFARLIRASNHPFRRLFHEEMAATSWLGEILNEEEQKRLRAFLARAA
jgi:hypothetical protein